MEEYKKIMYEKTFIVKAEPHLKEEVDRFFHEMEELDKEVIKNHLSFQVGFSIYFLKNIEEDTYKILTVNYKRNPFQYLTSDLTLALEMEKEQREFINGLGLERQESRFDDRVVIARDALSDRRFLVVRHSQSYAAEEDWDIYRMEKENEDFFALYAYQLLSEFEEMLKVFALPYEYAAVMEVGQIIEVRDNQNKVIYKK